MFHDDPRWPPGATSPLLAPPLAPSPPAIEGRLWRLSDLVAGSLLLILGFVAAVAVSIALTVLVRIERGDATVALFFTTATLLVEVWAGVIVLGLARRRGVSLRDLGFRAPNSWSLLPLALFGAYASLMAYSLAILAIERVTGADLAFIREGNRIPTDLPRTPLIWGTLGLAVVVAAPLCEELFFRGLIYRGLAGVAGPALGIIMSGLAFAVVHANLSVAVPFTLIGMIFAWVYRASGSLWTPIAAHAIVNGMSFVFAVYGVAS